MKNHRQPYYTSITIALLMAATVFTVWGNAYAAPPSVAPSSYSSSVIGNRTSNQAQRKPQLPVRPPNASQPAASGIAYRIITSTAVITPGTNDVGSDCDDCTVVISSPFGLNFYGTTYDTLSLSSNGNIQFGSDVDALHDQSDPCLPTNSNYNGIANLLALYWGDLRTDQNSSDGIYTATLGIAPNRQFVVEWRASYYERLGTANFAAIFSESSPNITVVYGSNIDRGDQELAGIQEGEGMSGDSYSQYSCDQSRLTNNLRLDYLPYNAQTTTPTPVIPTLTPSTACGELGGWAYTQPLTPTVQSPAVASDGSYVYSVGGYNNINQAGNFFRYNPANSTWITLTNAPDNLFQASAVYAPSNNKLYVFGGTGTNSSYLTSTLIYDIAANTWSSGAAMPDGRNSMVAGYGNGNIYLVGGQSTDGPQAQTWQYDVTAGTWITKTAAPNVMYGAAGTVINAHLYVVGGYDGNNYLNSNYDYDIAADTWTARANLPSPLYYSGAATLNGKLYIIGGGGLNDLSAVQPQTTNESFIYNPVADSWADGPLLNQPRSYVGATSLDNSLIAVGGYDFAIGQSLASVEVASLRACTPTPTLTVTPQVTATPTNCAVPFTDLSGNIFYNAIRYLYCRGVVNGVDATHYGPAGTSTRAQFAKVVVLGFGIQSYTPSGSPDFTDVPTTYFAYAFIEAGYHAGILSGFDANTCVNIGAQFPCYGPNRPITRAQLTKLVVGAAGYTPYTPATPTFIDVGPNNVFYVSIETAHNKGVINGYQDGTFRPNNNIRRDEMAQIVYKGVTTP